MACFYNEATSLAKAMLVTRQVNKRDCAVRKFVLLTCFVMSQI